MMHKKLTLTIILCILLASLQSLHAQQLLPYAPKTSTTHTADTFHTVEILPGARKLQIKKVNDTTELQILAGNVRLKQGNTLFYCDSCIINNNQHIFEAFGHVHINDSDTTDIYSDYLKYLTEVKHAYFNGNVKLTDGHGTLTTPDMDYDMNTKVGIYTKGGKVVNKKSVLTSQEGFYYSDLKDVYFKKNVVLVDPAYHLTADSLLYSTAFETVRFITKTIIVDSSKRTITTSDGYYDLKNGKAEFGKRPIVKDGKLTVTGDKIAFDDSTGISEALGGAIVVDSTNGTTIYGNKIFRNRKTDAILATQKPLMIIKQDEDSIYVSADTLFSARLTDLHSRPESFKKDSAIKKDSVQTGNLNLKTDSLSLKDTSLNKIADILSDTAQKNILVVKTDTAIKEKAFLKKDTLVANDGLVKKLPEFKTDTLNTIAQQKKDTTTKIAVLPKVDTAAQTTAAARREARAKSKAIIPKDPNKDSLLQEESLTGVNTLNLKENDSTNRYFEAFSHVRIFSDSMQAVCDSMFYSFHDSTFRLFKDPIIWSKENQITGDTVYMYTKNKKANRIKVWNNSLLVNKLAKEAYNQVKSSRMDGYFLDGELDSVRAKGSAECIYFIQDKDSAYTGINQSQSDIMDIYFKEKEIHRVVFRSSVKGTLWPIRQKNPTEMRLQNFKWLDARRPKTKYELFE